MTDATSSKFQVAIAELGERLAPLGLCDPTAGEALQQPLTRYGQLTAVVVFHEVGSDGNPSEGST